jgi:hypothetical protein
MYRVVALTFNGNATNAPGLRFESPSEAKAYAMNILRIFGSKVPFVVVRRDNFYRR